VETAGRKPLKRLRKVARPRWAILVNRQVSTGQSPAGARDRPSLTPTLPPYSAVFSRLAPPWRVGVGGGLTPGGGQRERKRLARAVEATGESRPAGGSRAGGPRVPTHGGKRPRPGSLAPWTVAFRYQESTGAGRAQRRQVGGASKLPQGARGAPGGIKPSPAVESFKAGPAAKRAVA